MDYKDVLLGRTGDVFWFQARNHLIDRILGKLNISNAKILNIGCGTGHNMEVISHYGDVYVIDNNDKALELLPKDTYIEKKVCDACNLDYPDNFFDIVVSFDVFEHIQDDTKSVAEVRRVLKPDGKLVVTVPAFPFLFSAHDEYLNHYRRYNKKTLKALLKDFSNVKLNYWNAILFIPNWSIKIFEKVLRHDAKQLRLNYYQALPRFIDRIFYWFLRLEIFLIKNNFPLPFGVSLVGYAKNKK